MIDVGPYCQCAQLRAPHKPHGFETALQVAQYYRWMYGEVKCRGRRSRAVAAHDGKSAGAGKEQQS